MTFRSLKTGNKCSMCTKNKKLTIEQVRELMAVDGYELLSTEYINAKSLLSFKCPNNHINKICYDSYSRGSRCINCTPKSKGEDKINELLNSLNIKYEPEKRFADCKNINMLPFDFYIDNDYIIEYDGQQHFKPVEYFGGIVSFERLQENDKIKTSYCRNNKICLLRICYKDFKKIHQLINDLIKNLPNYKDSEIYIHYSDDTMYDYLK